MLTLDADGRVNERIPWPDASEIARMLEATGRAVPAARYVDEFREAAAAADWEAAMPR